MSNYSIKDLEKLSGIKAHTIRIWEKRYRIVAPRRTDTNIRYYSDDDLKKIINVSLLNNSGLKISKIAELSSAELARKANELGDTKESANIHIDQLIVAMVDLDEESFEKILNGLIDRYGFERTIVTIVYAFLQKIGVLWQTGNIAPAQEHFISNLIRQKIIVAIDSLPLVPRSRTRVLLFLPEGELHELGLLFYYYIVKKAGFYTYYLGQMVPYKDVAALCESHNPRVLITAITSSSDVQGYLNKLCKDQPGRMILASGLVLRKVAVKIPGNLHLFATANELKNLLKTVK